MPSLHARHPISRCIVAYCLLQPCTFFMPCAIAVPAAGYFQKAPNQAAPCPKGQYRTIDDPISNCKICGNGITTASTNSTARTDCKCEHVHECMCMRTFCTSCPHAPGVLYWKRMRGGCVCEYSCHKSPHVTIVVRCSTRSRAGWILCVRCRCISCQWRARQHDGICNFSCHVPTALLLPWRRREWRSKCSKP